MTFTLKTLPYFIASVAILLGTSTSIAAKRPASSSRSVGRTELEMQVLLDRADFSPGEIDGKGGKNSREALAAFQASRGLAPGARSGKALLKALGAGTVKPIVLYTITAADVAGPFARRFRKTRRSRRNCRAFTTHPCWKSSARNSTRHRLCSNA